MQKSSSHQQWQQRLRVCYRVPTPPELRRVTRRKDSWWKQTNSSCCHQGAQVSATPASQQQSTWKSGAGSSGSCTWVALPQKPETMSSLPTRELRKVLKVTGRLTPPLPSELLVPPLAPQNAIARHRASMQWTAKPYWQFWAHAFSHIRNGRSQNSV